MPSEPSLIPDLHPLRETELQHLLVAYVITGLLFMLLPGTFLGVWNLISISSQHGLSSLSASWIQAHGHAQIFGWIGTFIIGIGYYSLSKMGTIAPFALSRGWLSWCLWTCGVALRWVANVSRWNWRIRAACKTPATHHAKWMPTPHTPAIRNLPEPIPVSDVDQVDVAAVATTRAAEPEHGEEAQPDPVAPIGTAPIASAPEHGHERTRLRKRNRWPFGRCAVARSGSAKYREEVVERILGRVVLRQCGPLCESALF